MLFVFCQLLVDELGHSVVGLLENVGVLAPLFWHLPTIVIYHYPSCVRIRVSHQLMELVYPITRINGSFDIGVAFASFINVVHVLRFLLFAQPIKVHTN